ncbi:hypothetical protein M1M27_gp37 [Cellulophaga phage Ingeline_1]|uniref:Uncharacterized protein n=1 Tax=Cellulophaga phage Ingeline_1 TaxID=2745674 RepID=A0A8E5EAJ8_9CAUD|nr:hypothetical protein M1M27_gp37 [Cellulophaga phage Ingeline_1]QQV90000.1 hypothetical protein Ingeline2_14 [Cellulophaga phage Ingeline_2]QQV90050.1 hypothetical protein Ingeline3_14 [Cellulophaga phage Ingeline_3]QQV90100.1 hypothetical protein Ingeline4_14 [Cellulophaga phage Ingeline_4]QQV90150.1 hypothetical protein Ingeline5_14 [Cellulophaga phage Ingeline_5]QQV90199.1 hypothetical protein Ingeline6_14 [Cellulophaga phage Ingeline_6]QQV90249.1 hypothetical protein Ingeline7_14 [Cellu
MITKFTALKEKAIGWFLGDHKEIKLLIGAIVALMLLGVIFNWIF